MTQLTPQMRGFLEELSDIMEKYSVDAEVSIDNGYYGGSDGVIFDIINENYYYCHVKLPSLFNHKNIKQLLKDNT